MTRANARRGGSAIETAFALPFLVMLLVAGADFAYLGLVEHQMGNAARAASRFGITGQAPELEPEGEAVRWCDDTAPSDNPRIERIRRIVMAASYGLLAPSGLCLSMRAYASYGGVGQPEPFADIDGNGRQNGAEAYTDSNGDGDWDADQGSQSAGVGDEVAVYTLRYRTAPLTGVTPGLPASRTLLFSSRIVVRNEPF